MLSDNVAVTLPKAHIARGLQRRDELLAQLRELFLAEGFADFSLSDLAERLKCSKSTLYLVAPSKEQIVVTTVRSYFRTAARNIQTRLTASGGAAVRLAVYLDAVASELQPASARFYADVAAFPPARDVYHENTQVAVQRVHSLVTEGVEAGVLRPVNASFVGAAVAQVMTAIQSGAIQSATGLDDAAAYRQLSDLVMTSLTNDNQPQES
jgi:AcrR family transcriptional regulator